VNLHALPAGGLSELEKMRREMLRRHGMLYVIYPNPGNSTNHPVSQYPYYWTFRNDANQNRPGGWFRQEHVNEYLSRDRRYNP